jgi:hypothetical protein
VKVTVKVKNQKTVDDVIAKNMYVIKDSDEDGEYSKMFIQFLAEHAREHDMKTCCETLIPDCLQQHQFPPMHGIEKSVLVAKMRATPVVRVIGNHEPYAGVLIIR